MSDRRPAAESALELLPRGHSGRRRPPLRHRGRPHRAASGTVQRGVVRLAADLPPGERDNPRLDVEELDAETDRLARWYGALIAVAGACDDDAGRTGAGMSALAPDAVAALNPRAGFYDGGWVRVVGRAVMVYPQFKSGTRREARGRASRPHRGPLGRAGPAAGGRVMALFKITCRFTGAIRFRRRVRLAEALRRSGGEGAPPTSRTPTSRAPTSRTPTSRAPTSRAPTSRTPTSRAPPRGRQPRARQPRGRQPPAPTSRTPTSRGAYLADANLADAYLAGADLAGANPRGRQPSRTPASRAPTSRAPTSRAPKALRKYAASTSCRRAIDRLENAAITSSSY